MGDGLDAVRDLLPDVVVEAADRLGGNDRSTVDRVIATYPDGNEGSLIVKRYRTGGEGWVRESAALSVLPGSVRTPRVVAERADPPVLVFEDLGAGPSVADALLGDDAPAAEAALAAWAGALATLHIATRTSRAAFRDALLQRRGELPVGESRVPADIEQAARVLDAECGALGVRMPAGALDELRGLVKRLGGSGLAALTPADACPDNNVLTADGLVLVDFEGAQWRHIAWDVAYLRVPWPTCWCAWQIPDAVADRAVAAYLSAVREGVPEAADPQFSADVAAAVVGWAVVTTTLFIDNALGEDPPLNPDRPTPTRRAMIQHRLGLAAGTAELPALAELAENLGTLLRRRWGDVPLALAPAFDADQ
jgi:hypothetical protein